MVLPTHTRFGGFLAQMKEAFDAIQAALLLLVFERTTIACAKQARSRHLKTKVLRHIKTDLTLGRTPELNSRIYEIESALALYSLSCVSKAP